MPETVILDKKRVALSKSLILLNGEDFMLHLVIAEEWKGVCAVCAEEARHEKVPYFITTHCL